MTPLASTERWPAHYEIDEEQPDWLDSDLPELLLDDPDDLREPAEFVEPPALT